MKWNEMFVEPRFYEIDSYNIVNNMYYMSWCEMARLKVSKDCGLLIPKLYDERIMFVVSEASIKYINAVSFWDQLVISTVVRVTKGTQLDFKHIIKSKMTKMVMATAVSSTLCLKDGHLMTNMPSWVEEKINSYISDQQGGTSDWDSK